MPSKICVVYSLSQAYFALASLQLSVSDALAAARYSDVLKLAHRHPIPPSWRHWRQRVHRCAPTLCPLQAHTPSLTVLCSLGCLILLFICASKRRRTQQHNIVTRSMVPVNRYSLCCWCTSIDRIAPPGPPCSNQQRRLSHFFRAFFFYRLNVMRHIEDFTWSPCLTRHAQPKSHHTSSLFWQNVLTFLLCYLWDLPAQMSAFTLPDVDQGAVDVEGRNAMPESKWVAMIAITSLLLQGDVHSSIVIF